MRTFYIKDIKSFCGEYTPKLQSMIDTTSERTVIFADGTRGFIIDNFVYAPFYITRSCIAQKDGKDIVLSYRGPHRMGLSVFQLPFDIPCEHLTFRHEKIDRETYLFRVFNKITLCQYFQMRGNQGDLDVSKAHYFCPVFDRHGHFIGINSGLFRGQRICVPIQDIL